MLQAATGKLFTDRLNAQVNVLRGRCTLICILVKWIHSVALWER